MLFNYRLLTVVTKLQWRSKYRGSWVPVDQSSWKDQPSLLRRCEIWYKAARTHSRMGMEGFSLQAPGTGKEQASQVGILPFRHGNARLRLGISLSSLTQLLTASPALSCRILQPWESTRLTAGHRARLPMFVMRESGTCPVSNGVVYNVCTVIDNEAVDIQLFTTRKDEGSLVGRLGGTVKILGGNENVPSSLSNLDKKMKYPLLNETCAGRDQPWALLEL